MKSSLEEQALEHLRGANLDGVDFQLNNRLWMKDRFADVRTVMGEKERLDEIIKMVRWTQPGPGGY